MAITGHRIRETKRKRVEIIVACFLVIIIKLLI